MGERTKLPLSKIEFSDRLRPVDEDHAMFIAAGMADEGLKTPIEVRPNKRKKGHYLGVAGGHRFRGAQILGWEEIECEVLDISADEARLREINENVYRVELSDLDRAVFLAEKKRLYEKLHPGTKHGGARAEHVAIFGDLAPRFTEETCERLGYSERTLQRVIARAKIDPAVRAKIAGSRIARTGSELDALLRLPPEQQLAAVDLILSGSEDAPVSVAAAARSLTGERPAIQSDDDQHLDALMKAWRRAGAPAKTRFKDFLVEQGEFRADPEQKEPA